MSEIEAYLRQQKRIWYKSTDLINMFGREELNSLFKCNKIEVRNGLNEKVVKLK